MELAINEINMFSNASGIKLNVSKTECILLGNLKDIDVNTFGIKVNTTCLKTLGVYVGHDKELCYRNNWIRCIADMGKNFLNHGKREILLLLLNAVLHRQYIGYFSTDICGIYIKFARSKRS